MHDYPTHRNRRGISLVELMIVVVVGAIILVPFIVFFVQMVDASRVSSEKLLLSSEAHVAAIAIRPELLAASGGEVYLSGSGPLALGTDGDEIQYVVGGVTRSMELNGTNLEVTEAGVSRTLLTHIGSFTARKMSNEEIEVTIVLRSQSNADTSTTLRIRIPMLNSIVGS